MSADPYMKTFTEEENKLRWKKNRVKSAVLQKVHVAYAFSKRKGDTVFHGTAMEILVSILKHGRLPQRPENDVPGPEAFWRGFRLPGSDTRQPLPEKLREWPEDGVEGWPLAPDISRILLNRDGCAAQFQVFIVFLCLQTEDRRRLMIHCFLCCSGTGQEEFPTGPDIYSTDRWFSLSLAQ